MAQKKTKAPVNTKALSNKSTSNTLQTNTQSKEVILNAKLLWAVLAIVFSTFCFSVFKNIQYPLFWADESMTVVGAERVLQFGYPKVHDGKNVFYDLRHSNPTLGIDEKTDAYIGGTSWGHYYFAAIGVKIAENVQDIYLKTGIIRFTFAFVGVLGLVLFVYFTSSLFKKLEYKLLYSIVFFFLSLFSISLALMLREARYYSLSIFLFSVIIGLYVKHRFDNLINLIVFRIIIAISLWCLFMTFAPVFFITIGILLVSEVLLFSIKYFENKDFVQCLKIAEPSLSAYLISFVLIYPFLNYFKTFEISAAMASFNGFNGQMFNDNVSTSFKFFKQFEFLWLALILKLIVFINFKQSIKFNKNLFLVSVLSVVVFLIYVYLIARVPNFIYTRYIVLLVPIIALSILSDFFVLTTSNDSNLILAEFKSISSSILIVVFISISFLSNSKSVNGHISELLTPYKGPLDAVIPAILDKYKNTDKLIVATNYEETSFMYYLKSKTTIGFIGNNLEEDAKVIPDVISYRKPWGNHIPIFQNFMQNAQFERQSFDIYDNPVNNIPELNFMPAFNHQFKTKLASNEQEKVDLYFRK